IIRTSLSPEKGEAPPRTQAHLPRLPHGASAVRVPATKHPEVLGSGSSPRCSAALSRQGADTENDRRCASFQHRTRIFGTKSYITSHLSCPWGLHAARNGDGVRTTPADAS